MIIFSDQSRDQISIHIVIYKGSAVSRASKTKEIHASGVTESQEEERRFTTMQKADKVKGNDAARII